MNVLPDRCVGPKRGCDLIDFGIFDPQCTAEPIEYDLSLFSPFDILHGRGLVFPRGEFRIWVIGYHMNCPLFSLTLGMGDH